MIIKSIMTEINFKLFSLNINKIPKTSPIQDDLEFVKKYVFELERISREDYLDSLFVTLHL